MIKASDKLSTFLNFVNAEDDCDVAMHRQQQQQHQLHTYVRGVDVVQRREEWPRRTNQNPSFVVRGAKPHAFLRSSFFSLLLTTVEGVDRKERNLF